MIVEIATVNDTLMVFDFTFLSLLFVVPRFLFLFILIYRFWCHFDDDNYVNIPTLVRVLNDYHAYHEWYLGKPSISSPIEMYMNAVSF